MILEKSNKTDTEQMILLINEAQKFIVQVRPSTSANHSIDITAVAQADDDDRPDPLRVPEIMIIICVLLLWLGSIFVFIRHSELLRIRHRDIPYRPTAKPPMNLNHITVVHRTSDMVIHSKPRFSAAGAFITPIYDTTIDEYTNSNTGSPLTTHLLQKERPRCSTISTCSISKYPSKADQLLNPYMIPSNIRRSLLDLHRKSVENIAAVRYSICYSPVDATRRKQSEDDEHDSTNARCIRESPV
ncbi:unnamed protein product [Adineta ricciae]|uniref:Uncharacterized protein n=1 Tax=Adineta ricciae TaxID=249248 RepID=A0A813QXQ1_ADIRI|nr:unnamed protein product [Adineta ricciae]